MVGSPKLYKELIRRFNIGFDESPLFKEYKMSNVAERVKNIVVEHLGVEEDTHLRHPKAVSSLFSEWGSVLTRSSHPRGFGSAVTCLRPSHEI